MATKVFEVDLRGARAASLRENVRTLDERQREAFGSDLSLSPQTPQAQWSGIVALGLTEIGEAGLRAALYGSSVEHAQGIHLDHHGSLLNIRRRRAAKSRVTATVYGVAGTALPAGSRARIPDGAVFRTDSQVSLTPQGAQAEMTAIEDGPTQVPAGSVTEIVSVVAGWERVTNANAGAVGRARQTDEEYRAELLARTAHVAVGPLAALESVLVETEAGRFTVKENTTNLDTLSQELSVFAHSILVIAEKGTDIEITRAIESHRGMGVGTSTAIKGGTPDDAALAAVSAGSVTWNGTAYPGLNLGSAATGAARAAALTALLAGDDVAPTIRFADGAYYAFYRWSPGAQPAFGAGSTESAFGLNPDAAIASPGPFLRPSVKRLSANLTISRRSGFPPDGLDLIRTALTATAQGYDLGETPYVNDFLAAAQRVEGTQVTAITLMRGSADASGAAVPLDALWSLPAANIAILTA